jgi:hypothetical protein
MVENNRGTYEFAYAPTGTQPLAWLQGRGWRARICRWLLFLTFEGSSEEDWWRD